jgi:protein EFR3
MQVHETARQVASVPVSANPVPYDQMKSQCEALVMEKQQKMSVLLSFKHSRTNSHGSTGLDGLETNEACISYLQNLAISCIIKISDFFPRE